MGLFGALYTGVAGLNAQAQAQSAISENVSNVNTVGYKKVETNFSTLVVESTPRSYSPGGPFTSTSYNISEQGNLQGTSSNTDIGISGDGFIIVNEAAVPGIKDEFFYTRAGKFTKDENGYLKNTAGYYLQGWALDAQGNKPTNNTSLISLQTINIESFPGKAIATTEATVEIQMPATSPIDSVANPSLGFVPGSQQSSDIVVYDSLGIPQTVRMVWTHVGTNAWNLTINPGSYGNPPVPNKVTNVLDNTGTPLAPPNKLGTPLVAGTQHLRVTFNNDGTLRDITNANTGNSVYNNGDGTVKIRFDFSASGANPEQDVSFNFGPKNPITHTIGASTATSPFAVATSSITNIFGTVLGSVSNVTVTNIPGPPSQERIDITIGGETFRGTVNSGAGTGTAINFVGRSSPVNGFTMTTNDTVPNAATLQTNLNTFFQITGTPTSFSVTGLPGVLKGLTQQNSPYSVGSIKQDGVPYGTYKGVTINEKGIVSGQFTNGLSQPLYQLPLATFANPNGLTPETGNVYGQTREAGDLILRDAGGARKILAATLENSTVDIGNEFAKMIITQRAYNANTRVVSTSRDMLAELDRLVQ